MRFDWTWRYRHLDVLAIAVLLVATVLLGCEENIPDSDEVSLDAQRRVEENILPGIFSYMNGAIIPVDGGAIRCI